MSVKSDKFLIENELQWESPAPGITRQIMGYDGQLMMVKVCFEEGAVGSAHEHINSQSTYVASGKFEITINGETKIIRSGDGFFVEPNLLHGAKCIEAGTLIDVFNPVRHDFL